ncbi:MAG: Gfo/Idh/MocA family oxidoreductase [Blastocatellia bacterium]|nr:Gfo/Idh/MocA family oxidoreductase [Blastocatellia bacterium]MCS7158296.1 Gfo/Idh/MocA family oxidoreductase [Blastocatellia bacterium]MCX7753134.1 Gfo/Idh/MocA family oxidoreductase [Blastocatellia bacterium]MDW8169449.1 Gfo/Idh/MocA family oxidoreductase [Acidobacteriota bacterium]MDW8255723.1 Gfo/Idh/MocA family oxidoreductase [Acidobacteriota bacterium]
MLRVAVVGVGRIGKEHARIYASLPEAILVGVCDIDRVRGEAIATQYAVPYYADYRGLIGRVDAVSVAVPTESHAEIACEFLENGVAVLVEKPMARTLEEAERMIRSARATGALLQVGHLERFNPAVSALSTLISEPKFFEVHRLGEFTERSLDIDVVLDLMIHDLDILLSLVNAEVRAVHAVGVPILTDRVDIANARLEFTNGCVANVTASRISREKVRKLRVFQPNAYISLDYTRQELEVYRLVASADSSGRPRILSERVAVSRDEPLRAQLEAFLKCVREGRPPLVGGEDGYRALALALRILAAIREHGRRAGIG